MSTRYIDPHIHMSSRTTDDYQAMAAGGIVAVIEPAFWLGQPRSSVGSFIDYFASLIGWERFRARQFGICHYCAMGLNAKEANDEGLAAEVLDILPRFAAKDGVVAIGEIGFDDQTPAEERAFRAQLDLAKELGLPAMIHTPHRDKTRGTLRSMDICAEHGLDPAWVVIDHNNEETVAAVLERGYWAGFTIYPKTKMGKERMAAVVAQYGPERIIVNSSADWGVSDPLSVISCAEVMRERGIPEAQIHATCYGNALAAYGQSDRIAEGDWADPATGIDQRQCFAGSTVLRGQEPRVGSAEQYPAPQ